MQPRTTEVRDTAASLSVALVTPPSRVVVDGELAEWGPAPLGVAFALTASGAYVVGAHDETGFWLGIRAVPANVPPVGEYRIIAGSEVDPEMGIVIPGCVAPTDATCVEAKKKIADEARVYEQRFERWYRIDRDRVRLLDSTGTLVAFERAKLARAGGSFEVALPLAGLPRFAEAPVATLGLAVRSGESAPVAEDNDWVVAKLETPVAFEPLGSLRALAFEDSEWMSYQPSLPLEVEVTRYPSPKDRTRFVIAKEALYTKQLEVGEIEVGYLAAGLPAEVLDRHGVSDRLKLAVVSKQGAPTALPIKGVPLYLMARGGEAHVVFLSTSEQLAHDGGPDATFVPVTAAALSGVIVSADGKSREISFDDVASPYWEDVEPFQGKDTLGLRGHASEWRQGIGKQGDVIELTWRWDAKQAKYVGKRTKGARPR